MINRDYPCNTSNYQRGRTQSASYLVIHYVGAAGGARDNARYYHTAPNVGASAHYFVGHAGEGAPVYASVAEADTAWHCGRSDGKYFHPHCRNANSIGIEMCCHQDGSGKWYFDPETVDAAVELARDVMFRNDIPINHVLRHYDVTGKICPAPFVNDPAEWESFLERLGQPETEEEDDMKIYHWIPDVPEWARTSAEKAYRLGIIKPDPNTGAVNLYEVNLQPLVWMDRLGLLD